ncbi:MAG: histidine kinase [Bacteroidota bacterium]|nr:MAG: histidine kinase [Bacteroidota bacterium]
MLNLKESQIRKERADKALQQIQIEKLKATQRYERLRNWLVYALSAAALITLSIIFLWLRNKQRQKALLEKQRYEVQLLESKLSVYSAQMNPHFMFNSMNAVNHFILNNNAMEASRYLTKYARLMRMVLDNSRQLKISLDRELQTLREYLDLERLRFSNSFSYHLQIDPELPLEDIEVPPLLLQPLPKMRCAMVFFTRMGRAN